MKAVSPGVEFSALEHETLEFWQKTKAFQTSIERRLGAKEYLFYDGPPFANGLPHYGHILTNAVKDTVPRYWTMRGFYVSRRFGWDCHGVPVEYEVEKRDKLAGRRDILRLGVDKFNETCRESVLKYAGEWQKTITRLGRWVDWDNQYRTMDKSYMESVWWVFSELYRKGLVYRDYKVVPYSPRITSVLSNFEANQNYKDVQDPAITVKFKLEDESAYILAWTTTPWTLISNLALCVGPDITYAKVKDNKSGEIYYLAEARVEATFKVSKNTEVTWEIIDRVPGSALKGRRYQPLFSYFAKAPGAFRILTDDYVTTNDGTGVVHQAPAFGEDDFRVCRAAGIELVDPIDEEGNFKSQIDAYAGKFVKDADKDIIRDLKESGQLLRQDTIVHSYPFCERTDQPLIYRAIPAWYVAVEKFRDDLVANNKKINWVPDHLRDGRMGHWLEGARDWAISRNRFWGTPLPIWVCDKDPNDIVVMGSAEDLEKHTGKPLSDLHKHFVDNLTFASTKTPGGVMRRVPEVFDCWFESGSMPYAQMHYPFENQERFKKAFPADFIAEGLDQTRGWFYTLSVLSTALFQGPAFKNVVVNGTILDETGRKMSKRHRNYTAPDALLEKYGADSVRLYMMSSSILRGEDLIFTDKGVKETTRAVLLPLWNAYSFLSTYAQADGWQPEKSLLEGQPPKVSHELDRWIISRLQTVMKNFHEQMEQYKLYGVTPHCLTFIEELTNWYIRLSRRRFWGSDDGDDADVEGTVATATQAAAGKGKIGQETSEAYATLYYVMAQFSKLFAPFAPFICETLYRNMADGMVGCPSSVHHCDMPMPKAELIDVELEKRMELVRRATDLGRSLRAKHQLRTRQPLASMLVITRSKEDQAALEKGVGIILSELNVKKVEFSTDEARYIKLSVKPNLKTLGKRLGKELNTVRQHLEKTSADADALVALLADLETKGTTSVLGHDLTTEDFLIDRAPKDERPIATERGVTVLLETKLDAALIAEGLSREIVNRVQKLRKDSGLNVSDRIRLELTASADLAKAATTYKEYIAGEVLAVHFEILADGNPLKGTFTQILDLEGHSAVAGISVV